jgi:CPA2 family monovalent cation:H+ antiporter-2
MLVIATPDTFRTRKMIEVARMLNPRIDTVVRTHSEEEAELLQKDQAGKVFIGEHELAHAMAHHILENFADGTGGAADQ